MFSSIIGNGQSEENGSELKNSLSTFEILSKKKR